MTSPPSGKSSRSACRPAQEIIMPALGMAQDTGLIVAWRKKPGDPVAAGDILLEVETDKSVMEVEAGHDGFVAAILADAQQAVPVGSVIAIITRRKTGKRGCPQPQSRTGSGR
jgi:pyruvate/2-oxoglutarate dehydrogenase complex dihydrolipoamide acyltransferase (E2) component